jgi:hypothetical protein
VLQVNTLDGNDRVDLAGDVAAFVGTVIDLGAGQA